MSGGMDIWAPFEDTFAVERQTTVKNGPRVSSTWVASGETLTGVLVQPGQRDLQRAMQASFPLTDVLVVGGTLTDVRPDDRLTNARGPYYVKGVEPLVQGRYTRLLLERRAGQ
jgi:hypothetical protein